MHRIGFLTRKGPDREYKRCKSRKKRRFAKTCRFEHRRLQQTLDITELVETKKSDTDMSKWINKTTKIKHLFNKRSYITKAINLDGTETKFIVVTE